MKYDTAVILIAFFGLSQAAPIVDKRSQLLPRYAIRGREVPQEHSHNKFLDSVRTSLNLNNPDQIQDPVFGLLGNAAAAVGQVFFFCHLLRENRVANTQTGKNYRYRLSAPSNSRPGFHKCKGCWRCRRTDQCSCFRCPRAQHRKCWSRECSVHCHQSRQP